jgi:hypothetical protein
MSERRSSFQDLPYVEYSPELFKDAVEIGGLWITPLPDGQRYAATWISEDGTRRMIVGGKYISYALQYRNAMKERSK